MSDDRRLLRLQFQWHTLLIRTASLCQERHVFEFECEHLVSVNSDFGKDESIGETVDGVYVYAGENGVVSYFHARGCLEPDVAGSWGEVVSAPAEDRLFIVLVKTDWPSKVFFGYDMMGKYEQVSIPCQVVDQQTLTMAVP